MTSAAGCWRRWSFHSSAPRPSSRDRWAALPIGGSTTPSSRAPSGDRRGEPVCPPAAPPPTAAPARAPATKRTRLPEEETATRASSPSSSSPPTGSPPSPSSGAGPEAPRLAIIPAIFPAPRSRAAATARPTVASGSTPTKAASLRSARSAFCRPPMYPRLCPPPSSAGGSAATAATAG
jgi:hypothetical protein